MDLGFVACGEALPHPLPPAGGVRHLAGVMRLRLVE